MSIEDSLRTENEDTRSFSEIESDSSSLQRDEEDGHFGILHEVLDRVVACRRSHVALKSSALEASDLQTASDQVKHTRKL